MSSVLWNDILDVHCTDRVTFAAYRCIEEDNFTVNYKRCLILLMDFFFLYDFFFCLPELFESEFIPIYLSNFYHTFGQL